MNESKGRPTAAKFREYLGKSIAHVVIMCSAARRSPTYRRTGVLLDVIIFHISRTEHPRDDSGCYCIYKVVYPLVRTVVASVNH